MSKELMIKNTAYMYAGEIISKVFQFVFIILLTRFLGAEDFGKISFALSMGWVMICFGDLGMTSIILREMSLKNSKINYFNSRALSLKFILGIVTLLGLFAFLLILHTPAEKILIIFIISLSFFLDSVAQLFRSALISTKNMLSESIIRVVFGGSKLLIFLIMWYFNFGLIFMAMVYIISSCLTLFVSIIFYYRKIGGINVVFDKKYSKELFLESYPLFFGVLFVMLIANIDVIMVGILKGDYYTGIYSAPTRLIQNAIFFSEILILSTYPYLAKYLKDNKQSFVQLMRITTKMAFLFFIPIIVFSIIFHKRIVGFLFGADYVNGSVVLAIFSFVLIFYYFLVFYSSIFTIMYRTRLVSLLLLITLVISIILNYILIKQYSIIGAAVATVLSYFIFAVLAYIFFNIYCVKIKLNDIIFRCVILFLFVLGISYAISSISLFLIILIMIPIYLLFIVLLRILSLNEIKILLQTLKLDKFAKKI